MSKRNVYSMATSGRVKGWKELFSKNAILPVAFDRQQEASDVNAPFNIHITAVDGLIPKNGKGDTEYQLQISLYDLAYKQFFGRTWVGPMRAAKTVGQQSRLNYNQSVYLHTSLNDQSIALVLELVAVTRLDEGRQQRVGCGWGLFSLFGYDGDMPDSSSTAAVPTQRVDIYHGSPRALLFLEEPIQGNPQLTLINGCHILYTIRTHRYMHRVMQLIPENVLVGPDDVIPGLADGVRDPRNPTAGVDSLRKPRLQRAMTCSLERISINLGTQVEQFETEMCRLLNEDRIQRGNAEVDGGNLEIRKRYLEIGVHNGWTYVSEPEVVQLTPDFNSQSSFRRTSSLKRGHVRSLSNTSGASSCLVHKNRIQLDGLLEDPLITIVFVLIYELGEPRPAKDRRASLVRSSFNVSLRWTAFCPLANLMSSEHTLQLNGGPSTNPSATFMFCSMAAEGTTNGTLSFTFTHSKKANKENTAVAGGMFLHVPQFDSPQWSTPAGEGDSALRELQPSVLGKPPSGTPRRESAAGMSQQDMIMVSSPGGPRVSNGYPRVEHSPRLLDAPQPHDGSTTAAEVGSADLQELPFTPAHAPILATTPGYHSGQSLSRAAYAKLYTAGFEAILDRHGEAPEVADPADSVSFMIAKEEADRLQTNEIVFQFLAFSRMLSFDSAGVTTKQPATVFFTFQFYRFPQVTSERLLLGSVEGELSADPQSLPCVLQRLDQDGSVLKAPPGYQVKYSVDPGYLKPGEGHLFVQHLKEHLLHIDVWDGDSLLLIGSTAVELKHLCRQARTAVQVTYELDVLSTDYTELESAVPTGHPNMDGLSINPGDQPMTTPTLRGRLHLRMANVGQVAEGKLGTSNAFARCTKSKCLISSDSNNSLFSGGSLTSIRTLSEKRSSLSRAQHLADTSHELASVLIARQRKAAFDEISANREASQDKKRKLARMHTTRQREGADSAPFVSSSRQEKVARGRDLKTLALYRAEGKREGILNMISQAITTEHTIFPSLGAAQFFEFALVNPANVSCTVVVESDDLELVPITDAREWRHYKMLNQLYTSVEEGLFNMETASGKPEVFIRPRETVSVPFKYLTFKADHRMQPEVPSNPYKPATRSNKYGREKEDSVLDTRVAKVYFKSVQDGRPIAILALRIETQPHVVDHTFRFHHPEHTFLKKCIRLPQSHHLPGVPVGGAGVEQVFVRCSDQNVICDSRKISPGEPHDVFLKVACAASPHVRKFFVVVYRDQYLSRPVQIWQVCVHALQRVDVACTEGQTSRFSLTLRGTQASRLVQCYVSHSAEMRVSPAEPFMLTAGATVPIAVGVRPLVAGQRQVHISVVDVDQRQLVRRWLVCAAVATPVVSRAFELLLPVGGGANKRITYTNPYAHRRTFHVRSSAPDLLQLRDSRLDIAPGEAATIAMRFPPVAAPRTAEILVFVNDDDDKTEETFCVRAIYS